MNDCAYTLSIICDVLLEDPSSSDPSAHIEKANVFQVIPDTLTLEENSKAISSNAERSTASVTLRLQAPLPVGQDGVLDTAGLAALLAATTQRSFLRLQVTGGAAHVVPVLYQWVVKHLVALMAGVKPSEGTFLESDKLRTLDFGEVVSGNP